MIDQQLAQAWQKLRGVKIQELPCENDYETGELYIETKPMYVPINGLDIKFEKQRRQGYEFLAKQWDEQMQNGPKAWAYLVRENDWENGITWENWSPIPDIEEDPWSWVLAFTDVGWNITIGGGTQFGVAIVKSYNFVIHTTGETSEKAFETAIREWERTV